MPANLLTHVYLISTGLGSIYLVYSFLSGQFGDGNGDPTGDAEASADAATDGVADDLSSTGKGIAGQALTVTNNQPARNVSGARLLVALLSPMSMSMFLTFFGLAGLLVSSIAGFLGPFSALIAGIIGLTISNLIQRTMTSLSKQWHVTSAAKPQDMIGQVAKVTVSIEAGGVGRITYSMLGMRCTAIARAAKPDIDFKTGSTVIISDFQGRVALVEAWTDSIKHPD